MEAEARRRLCSRPLGRDVLLLFVWPPLFPWQLPLSPAVSEEDLLGGVSFWEKNDACFSISGDSPSQYLQRHEVSYYLGNAQLSVDWWESQVEWGERLGVGRE